MSRTHPIEETAEKDIAFLAAIVESSDDAIISKDLDSIITSWNNGAERIFGYKAEEVIGQPITILIPPERINEEGMILERIRRGERVEHFETVRSRKDGSHVDVSLTVSPIKNGKGKLIGASKTARDFTEQRRNQEKLRQSEERFRVTLSSIGDAVIATDNEGRVTFMNSVAEDLTGWHHQEGVGVPLESLFSIINEMTRKPIENPVLRVLREGSVVGLANHTVLVSKNGTERPIDDSAAPIRDSLGHLSGVVLVFRDATRERAAMLAAQRFASMVDNSGDAIYSEDLNGLVTSWNKGAERTFGYSAQEAIGKPITSLIVFSARESEHRGVIRRIQEGERLEQYETTRTTKDGREINVSMTVSLIKEPSSGRILGISKVARDTTDQKRAETALRQSEALKTAILNSGLDCIVTMNHDCKILEFNRAAERTFGYARKDVIGKSMPELLIPVRLRDAHWRGIKHYLDTGERTILDQRIEMPALRSDGSEFLCELAVSRVPVEGPPLFTAFVRDITKRKQNEEALRGSEERFRQLAETIPQLAWIAHPDGWIFWYNQRWFDYTGTTLDEMQGWGWQKVHHPEHVGRVVEKIRHSFSTGELWEDTFPLRGKNGKFRWFLSRAFPIRDGSGKITRWFGTNTDVTELRDAQTALAEREAVLRTVTNEARVGLVMVDKDRHYLFANHTYAEILGLPDENIVGKRVSDVLSNIYEQVEPHLDRAFAGERVTDELRVAVHPKTGEEHFYEVVYEPRAEDHTALYVVVVIIDITERKKAQENLERTVAERTSHLQQSVAELEAFSFTISHDLRSPLRAMQGFAQAVLEEYADKLDSQGQEYLKRISDSAVRLDTLIREVLTYSRIARATLTIETVDLEKLVDEVIQTYPSISAPQAEIKIERPLHPVRGSRSALVQCVSNLLENAVKFVSVGAKAKVHVWTEKHNSNIRFFVADNGIGIPEDLLSRIFEPFQRAHPHAGYEGTGMGLAIVKKATQRMGGTVGVESQVSKGSTFWLELPAVE